MGSPHHSINIKMSHLGVPKLKQGSLNARQAHYHYGIPFSLFILRQGLTKLTRLALNSLCILSMERLELVIPLPQTPEQLERQASQP